MAKKAICIYDNERVLLDNIALKEIASADGYTAYKKLCKQFPEDYKEITLSDEEHNRIIKYKQETLALDLILNKLWNIN
tara:strand:- start:144 stop:380 length:237 start_codon:yes stop_codon:yes gene_type:complete